MPLLYALTGLGTQLSAVSAALLALTGAGAALTHHNPFTLAQSEAVVRPSMTLWQKGLKQAGATAFISGQFGGAASALFTQFHGWNPGLSAYYRTCAAPFLLSGMAMVNPGFRPLGLGASDLAKLGAFVQASSYFANLLVKPAGQRLGTILPVSTGPLVIRQTPNLQRPSMSALG